MRQAAAEGRSSGVRHRAWLLRGVAALAESIPYLGAQSRPGGGKGAAERGCGA
ncbi:unnamed protein product [[Actinomadura] parvosata subsp. kistnae]|nr:unnamed protein product [Actinomadura parvosata subsp. kistnae]